MEHGILCERKSKSEKDNIAKIFLVIAMTVGMISSLIQPLFIEPDASFHFDSASYIADTVVDRAKVGFPQEDYESSPVPFSTVSTMKKEGVYFKKFFETKLTVVPKSKVADKRVIKLSWTQQAMHLIPALGIKMGHMIYPSIGAMIITARLFNLIFFALAMFFIIKNLKAYRLLFTAISLTPTVIQFATSLSYDCFNYVACAWMIATLLNVAVDIKDKKELSLLDFLKRIIFPSVAISVSKTNSILLFILVAALLIYLIGKKLKISVNKVQAIIGIVVLFLIGLGYAAMRFGGNGSIKLIASKFFYTFLEPYYTVLTTEVISGTNTAGVPAWFFGIQFAMLILLLLSCAKEVVPRWFAWSAAAVSVLNLFGILLQYSTSPHYPEHVITGPQGRYFTAFILLLAPIFTLLATKIQVSSGKWLKRMVIVISILALFLNIAIISVRFYHLQLPADEYRSGIEHYIFK